MVSTADISGFQQMELPDISWRVAPEAVLNALVHRDYFLHQSIHLTLHDGRAEITSPGGFTGGVTVRNVLRHPPVRRNPLLADVLQAIGLVNRAGLGVDRIYEEMLLLGKDLPRYDADESHVRLVLPTRTHARFVRFVHEVRRGGGELGLDDLILLRGLTRRGSLDRWTAAELLQLPESEAAARLVSLRERGYLAARGRGRGTHYRLARRHAGLVDAAVPTEDDVRVGEESYTGTRPSKASVQRTSRRMSDMTARKHGWQSPEVMVKRLNRTMVGWAQYFSLGHVSPACAAVNRRAVRRLCQWLGRKYRTKSGNFVRIPVARLQYDYGLISLSRQTLGLPSAKARPLRAIRCRASGDRSETVLRHQRQELQRRAPRALLSTLPLAHQTRGHVEVAREHRLARMLAQSELADVLRRHFPHRRQAHLVEHPHGPLRHDACLGQTECRLVRGRQSLTLVLLGHRTSPRQSLQRPARPPGLFCPAPDTRRPAT